MIPDGGPPKVHNTVKTRIIRPCARILELPHLERSGVFYFYFYLSRSRLFAMFFAPSLEEENLDYTAYCPFTRVLTGLMSTIITGIGVGL